MPVQVNKDFTILYGSQTGQAEAISEEIYDRSFKEGFTPVRYSLGQIEKKFSIEKETCIVIVCSTTGEGEPPDNALKFVRRIKKKTLSSRHLQHLKFAVLGLGDSNYTNFCNCPKTIVSRLLELGATMFYETGYGDDAVGLEEAVEPWIEGLFPVLRDLKCTNNNKGDDLSKDSICLMQSESTVDARTPDDNQNHVLDVKTSPAKNERILTDNNEATLLPANKEATPLPVNKESTPVPANKEATPLPVNNESTQVPSDEDATPLSATLKSSISPLSTSALKIPAAPAPYIRLAFIDEEPSDKLEQIRSEYPGAATPLKEATIISARQLTFDDSVKKCLEVEFSVKDLDVDYEPGDSFGIVCENNQNEVDYLITRLQIQDIADRLLTTEIKEDTLKKSPTLPQHIQSPSTLRHILSRDVDFRAVPRKALLRMLVDYTDNETEKRRLQELCSTQGAKDYGRFVREDYVGLVQLLQTFESCTPPIESLLELLPQLLPREYSIASYSIEDLNRIKFVFNVIELPEFGNCERWGLCTSWLESMVTKMKTINNDTVTENMKNMNLSDDNSIRLYFRRPTSFRLPVDPLTPLIMIGPGTGVAPFIGFLQKRKYLKEKDPTLMLGISLLFFGCRYKEKDFLYKEELSVFKEEGLLTELYTSFSRDEINDESHTKYVQENIKRYKEHVLRLIFENNGVVFICGDAKHMGRDVTNTFVELIEDYKGVSKVDAIKVVNGLRESKQFLEDVWT